VLAPLKLSQVVKWKTTTTMISILRPWNATRCLKNHPRYATEEGCAAIDCGCRCISSGAFVARTDPRGTSRPGPDQLSHRCEVSPQPPAPCVHAARRVLFCHTEMWKSSATTRSDGCRPTLHPVPAACARHGGEGVAQSRGLASALLGPCRDAEGTLATCPVPNSVQS